MAVKRSLSATRMLSVFETLSKSQPAGVSGIARALGANKSAVQRDLMTLSDAGWIRQAPDIPGSWELTPHILSLAQTPHSDESLRQRAKPVMERLRNETGETVYLAVPHGRRFIVIAALESQHMLRMVPAVGMHIATQKTATAKVMFAHMSPDEVSEFVDSQTAAVFEAMRDETLSRGYAINDGDVLPGSVTMAAAIVGAEGKPVGAIVVTGPAERITQERKEPIGQLLREAAYSLSAA